MANLTLRPSQSILYYFSLLLSCDVAPIALSEHRKIISSFTGRFDSCANNTLATDQTRLRYGAVHVRTHEHRESQTRIAHLDPLRFVTFAL